VDVEHLPGRFINRDISKGEVVDADLDRLIERRSRMRVLEEGERAEEEAWVESTKKTNAAREAELREQWSSYHLDQAERHKAVLEDLVAHHKQQAQKLGASLGASLGGDAA
jgi:hypothetical protein